VLVVCPKVLRASFDLPRPAVDRLNKHWTLTTGHAWVINIRALMNAPLADRMKVMQVSALNTDFRQRVVIDTTKLPWIQSPSAGVWRRPLERGGAESGRATSIVRYDPASAFPSHTHPDGEEILVLEGVFSDEWGDYPAGTYLLNPPGSRHAPQAPNGCLLFVKLCQYRGSTRPRLVLNTTAMQWQRTGEPGIFVKSLYSQAGYPETMELMKFEPGARSGPRKYAGGVEILVLEGSVADDQGNYAQGTWMRNPAESVMMLTSEPGCVLFIKTGGLD
jgi:anti-sigma factor ChrR (cupin superfamily)